MKKSAPPAVCVCVCGQCGGPCPSGAKIAKSRGWKRVILTQSSATNLEHDTYRVSCSRRSRTQQSIIINARIQQQPSTTHYTQSHRARRHRTSVLCTRAAVLRTVRVCAGGCGRHGRLRRVAAGNCAQPLAAAWKAAAWMVAARAAACVGGCGAGGSDAGGGAGDCGAGGCGAAAVAAKVEGGKAV